MLFHLVYAFTFLLSFGLVAMLLQALEFTREFKHLHLSCVLRVFCLPFTFTSNMSSLGVLSGLRR